MPLSQRTGARALDGLYEGVPDWLVNSLTAWLRGQFWFEEGGWDLGFDRALAEQMERQLRSPLLKPAMDATNDLQCWSRIQDIVRSEPDLFLDVVDFVLRRWAPHTTTVPSDASDLAAMLDQAGSAWQVAVAPSGDHPRLERRIGATVRSGAVEVMNADDRASDHLRNAWEALYGRSPSAGEGYREAVRAVEAVAKPVILPLDERATLGRMIAGFRDAPARWTIMLAEAGRSDPPAVVLGMMEMLWTSQHDRHGTDDESVPLNVSTEEARAALHLALTLVQWFRTGVVAAVTDETATARGRA